MSTLHLKHGGTWKQPNNVYYKSGGSWYPVESVWERNGGVWIKHWPSILVVPFSPSTGYSLGSTYADTQYESALQLNTSTGAFVTHMTSISLNIKGHRTKRKNDHTNYTTSYHTISAGANTVNDAHGGRTGAQVWSGTASVGTAKRSSVESQILYVPTTHVLQGISTTVHIVNDDDNHSSYTSSYYSFKILTAPLQRGDGTAITAGEISYGAETVSGGEASLSMMYDWDLDSSVSAVVPNGNTARSVEFGFYSQDWTTGTFIKIRSNPTTVTLEL